MNSVANGFAVGIGLILAIGAQNAFVLRQGLRREHIFAVCLTCALSDALLIILGIAGLATLKEAAPWIEPVFRLAGAAFLIVYGARSALAAWRGGASLMPSEAATGGLGAALATCLALTWLNPHVYLDTVLLIGAIAAQSPSPVQFGIGAVTASFVFFFALGYGAARLRPVFTSPAAWRRLEAAVALLMWAIAARLLMGF